MEILELERSLIARLENIRVLERENMNLLLLVHKLAQVTQTTVSNIEERLAALERRSK